MEYIIIKKELSSNSILPKVQYGKKNYDSKVLCILERSELFFQDMLVSFYYNDSRGFEELIGIGTVYNIQENKKIQVRMDYPNINYKKIIENLKNNEAETLSRTVVKPNVPKEELGKLMGM